MRVIALSDMHGILPKIEEEFDLLLICGDICPVWNHMREFQWNWINDQFAEWVKGLPFKDDFSRVVMIAGNHDFVFEGLGKHKRRDWLSKFNHRLVYLDNEEYTFEYYGDEGLKEYRIFGTPYCKVFGTWAFMRENLEKYFDVIPEGLDILISHDAPKIDNFGIIQMGRWKGENAGNPVLAEAILRTKPKYALHGHIHSSPHKMKNIDGTNIACVSIVDENYQMTYEPLILKI